jgi:hypothetical protein
MQKRVKIQKRGQIDRTGALRQKRARGILIGREMRRKPMKRSRNRLQNSEAERSGEVAGGGVG